MSMEILATLTDVIGWILVIVMLLYCVVSFLSERKGK